MSQSQILSQLPLCWELFLQPESDAAEIRATCGRAEMGCAWSERAGLAPLLLIIPKFALVLLKPSQGPCCASPGMPLPVPSGMLRAGLHPGAVHPQGCAWGR